MTRFSKIKNILSFNWSLSQKLHWRYNSHWGVWALTKLLSTPISYDFWWKGGWCRFRMCLNQGRSQEFCSGGAVTDVVRFQTNYFAQRSFWCYWSIFGLLQQDMTSNIFYQSASINFNKDKNTFAFAVIIIKQLLTKQSSMNIKSSGKRNAV